MYPQIQNSEIFSTFTTEVIFSISLILKFLPWERKVSETLRQPSDSRVGQFQALRVLGCERKNFMAMVTERLKSARGGTHPACAPVPSL